MTHTQNKKKIIRVGSVFTCPCGKNYRNEKAINLHQKFCEYAFKENDTISSICPICGKVLNNSFQIKEP